MAFKIVGVDENSHFPERVEDRLNNKFATPAMVEEKVSKTSLDNSVSALVEAEDTETGAAIRDLIVRTTDNFVFDIAEASYGIRVGGASTTRVMQSISFSNLASGQMMTAYAVEGSTGSRETTLVTIHSAAGRAMGEMRFIDAGHATGVFAEFSTSGEIFIWTSFTNHAVSSGMGRYNYVRVPWSPGTSHTWATASQYKVSALSRANYLTAHYDAENDIIGVREDPGGGTGATFTVHTLPNLQNGVWAPTLSMSYEYPTDTFIQGWAYLDGFWYIYSGSSEEDPPYYPASILQVDASTGQLRLRRFFEEIRASSTGYPLYGFSEPEGIAIARGYNGTPVIVVGVSSGEQGGRSHALWTIGSPGVTPFHAQALAGDANAGATDWSSYPFIPIDSSVTINETDQKFGVRRKDGYLEIVGRLDKLMPRGTSTPLGTLRPGFYNPNRHIRGLASKSSVTVSPDVSVRVDINVSGGFSVFASLNGTGEAGWIDFTGFRAPLD